MFFYIRNIKEEIDYYERQNKRLSVDDLLDALSGKKQKHHVKIIENEKRIMSLCWSLAKLISQ